MLFIASNYEQNGLGPCNISQYHFIISVCNYLVSFTLRSQLSYIFFPAVLEWRENNLPATQRSLLVHKEVGVQFVVSHSEGKQQIFLVSLILTYSTVAV